MKKSGTKIYSFEVIHISYKLA